jgi:hypothetical protein
MVGHPRVANQKPSTVGHPYVAKQKPSGLRSMRKVRAPAYNVARSFSLSGMGVQPPDLRVPMLWAAAAGESCCGCSLDGLGLHGGYSSTCKRSALWITHVWPNKIHHVCFQQHMSWRGVANPAPKTVGVTSPRDLVYVPQHPARRGVTVLGLQPPLKYLPRHPTWRGSVV